jgi:hypothetical protein
MGGREHRGEARAAAGALTFLGLASVALVKLAVGAASPGLAPEHAALLPARLAATPAAPHAYTLEADLDPAAHTIAGKGTIDFVNTSRRPIDELWVHLYLNAFESEETVFQRGPRGGFRGGGRSAETGSITVERFAIPAWGDDDLWPAGATTPGEPKDRTDIRVALPRAVPPGDSVRIAIAWTSKLPPVTLRTGYAGTFHMVGQWFPKIAKLEPDGTFAHFPFERLSEFYADFAEWDVRVRTPASFVVGATGREVEATPDGDHVIRRFTQRQAHDFAFAAGDRLVERRATHGAVELRALGPPGFETALELELKVAARGLDLLGARYGTYPHPTLTIVHPPSAAPEAGGMEYPALITTGGPWWAPVAGARFTELVTMHELAHQWFQGTVASNEREHPFLDEGLTSFAELEAMEEIAPGSTASAVFGLDFGTLGFYRSRSVEAARLGTVARAARDFSLGSDYGDLVYGRTATQLATLDRVWPRELRRALGVYARRHRFAHPGPSDLLAVVRTEMGDVAADALRAGLMERGTVDFVVRNVASRALGDGRHVVDVDVGRAGAIVLPVEIDVIDEAGDVYRTTWDGRAPGAVVSVETSAPVARVVVDPELRVVCDGDLFDQTWSAEGARTSGRTLGATSFVARVLLAGVGP